MSETTCFTVVFEGDVRAIEDNPFGIESPFGKPQQVMLGDVHDLIAEETEGADRTKRELDLVYEAIPLPFSLEPPDGGAVSASEAVKKMVATIGRLEAELEEKRLITALMVHAAFPTKEEAKEAEDWIKANPDKPLSDYCSPGGLLVKQRKATIARLEADNKRLWNALDDVLWMAEEWYEHGGKDTTMNEDDAYGKALENARAAFIALTGED